MIHPLKIVGQLLVLTIKAWIKDDAARLGAALAFYSVLSLGPLLLLVLVAAASLWGEQAAQGQIVAQMTGILGHEGAKAVQDLLKVSSENEHAGMLATIFGFGTLFFSASAVFGELQAAMNVIWKVPPHKGPPIYLLLTERLVSFAMVVASGLILILSLTFSTVMQAVWGYATHLLPILAILMPVVDFVTSFLLITLLFAMTFKLVPDKAVRWGSVWLGAALTALLFIMGKFLISMYLAHTSVASSYGAAGSVIIILLWVYYSAQILFFGAEFAHVYDELRLKPKKKH